MGDSPPPPLPPPPPSVEELARRAAALRVALERSEGNTERMVAALGSVGHRASAVEAAMRPALVRANAAQMVEHNIDRTIDVANAILAQMNIARQAEATLSRGPQDDLENYLEAVDTLKGIARFFSDKNFKTSEGVLKNVNDLLTKSILEIEEEFRRLMLTYSKPIEPDRLFGCLPKTLHTSKGDSDFVEEQASKSLETAICRNPTLIPTTILSHLHDLAHQLVEAGHHQSCYQIYRLDARGSALALTLRKLGTEKLSNDDVQKMQWEAIKPKIGNWNHFLQITVKVLLPGERKNCDLVFEGITFNKDQCFAELAGIHVMALLSFGDAVAKSKRSPEKLSALLTMYGVMHELRSEVEVTFQGRFCSEMRGAAFNLTKSLAQTVKETLVDFEEEVEKHTSNIIIQDGNVHPLTINVMNYIKSLFEYYHSTLEILFQQLETGIEASPTVVMMRIIQALQKNLDRKSKQYKDSALSCIFLMNNVHYMVGFIRRSEAKDILGDDWIQKHRRVVLQSANQYKRVAWAKILQTLSIQAAGGTGSSAQSDPSSSGVSRAVIKERFKSFNVQFEELHAKHSQWTISDQELRESLRLAIAELVLPAYRSFITRFGNLIERGKNPHKYIKQSPEELEKLLDEFFEGQLVGEQKQ
ncbi:hypothetical protein ACP4OV_003197 [Aristida adscensionis]